MSEFDKIVEVRLPFDRSDPDPKKNYGNDSLRLWYILKGEKGAVQFAFSMPVYLPHVQFKIDNNPEVRNLLNRINGFDVGYHSKVPRYNDQPSMECKYVDGGKCYYDGSSLRAEKWVNDIFAITGSHPEDEIWRRLENEYRELFEIVEGEG